MNAGMRFRYVDNNNYYSLTLSTTALSITKKQAGTITTLASFAATYLVATYYRMHLRIVGSNPVNLFGKIWLDGIREPAPWTVVAVD